MDKVKTSLQEKTEWYDRLLQSIHAMKPQDDPTTTTAQIKAQQVVSSLIDSLDNISVIQDSITFLFIVLIGFRQCMQVYFE